MTQVAVGARSHEGLRERLVFHAKADTITRVAGGNDVSGIWAAVNYAATICADSSAISRYQCYQCSVGPLGRASLAIRGESVIQTLLPCYCKKLSLENIYISCIYPLDKLKFELAS